MTHQLELDRPRRGPSTPCRVLAMDAVQKVGNGHPGTAMSLAPAAYLLFQKVMRHDPADPHWLGRDRFVLSCGHSSLTLYIQLYLGGFGLELDDLKALRTWGIQDARPPRARPHRRRRDHHRAARPGRRATRSAWRWPPAASAACSTPTPRPARARSTTTSTRSAPTATSRRASAARRPRSPATSSSATSTLIYDANQISIEDDTDIAFSEDVGAALRGLRLARADRRLDQRRHGVRRGRRGALEGARGGRARSPTSPSFIVLRTIIAWPAPERAEHRQGARLRARRRRGRGHQEGPRLRPRPDLRGRRRGARPHPRRSSSAARAAAGRVGGARSTPGRRSQPRAQGALRPDATRDACPTAGPTRCRRSPPTRRASPPARRPARCSTRIAPVLPELWGGSADLAESNNTTPEGRAVVRPRGALHQGVPGRPSTAGSCTSASASTPWARSSTASPCTAAPASYGGTFLVFSDYMRPAVRLAALMQLPGHLRLDPRLDRPRRGRPDPPAGRAPRRAAGDPRPRRRPPGRRQRDRRRLADDPRAHRPPGRPRA